VRSRNLRQIDDLRVRKSARAHLRGERKHSCTIDVTFSASTCFALPGVVVGKVDKRLVALRNLGECERPERQRNIALMKALPIRPRGERNAHVVPRHWQPQRA
jgi:hypothetical protein